MNKQLIKYNNYLNWGLGIGDWGLGPIPNPQSPIPNFLTNQLILLLLYLYSLLFYIIK